MSESRSAPHPYQGRRAVLATKHRKEEVIEQPLRAAIGLRVCVPPALDTDLLGTFTGEIERHGTPREVALRKARMGMGATGSSLGLANEGSFGPHPYVPFVPADHELLAWVDDDLGTEVVESVLSLNTNFAYRAVRTLTDLQDLLVRASFPSHGLIVRPNTGLQPDLLFKGITDVGVLQEAVERCSSASGDGLAHVETDMRAHMNPTRMCVIGELAERMARRLATLCPQCATPGWGVIDVVLGLPCESCGCETDLVRAEVHGCPRCGHRETRPRSDGLRIASAGDCTRCNP